ncbi:MAG: hypothetical protein WCI72_03040 [archaeon]
MTDKTLVELLKQAADPYNCVIKKQPEYRESWTDEDTIIVQGAGIIYNFSTREVSVRTYKNEYGLETKNWSGLVTQDRITFEEDTPENAILAQVELFLQRHGFNPEAFFEEIKFQQPQNEI